MKKEGREEGGIRHPQGKVRTEYGWEDGEGKEQAKTSFFVNKVDYPWGGGEIRPGT